MIDAYYPDGDGVEVQTHDGEEFSIADLVTCEQDGFVRPTGQIEPIAGSVQIMNYYEGSSYSQDEFRFPYKLFRFWSAGTEMCLLISDTLTITGTVVR